MQALGLIETRGLLPAIECLDIMLKTAQVELMEKCNVGGGLVTIAVTGDIGAVQASVEAGASTAQRLGDDVLIARHVIPRPHDDIERIIGRRNGANIAKESGELVQPIPHGQVVEQTPKQSAEQVLEQAAEEAPWQAAKQTQEQAAEETPEQTVKQMPEQAAGQTSEQVPELDEAPNIPTDSGGERSIPVSAANTDPNIASEDVSPERDSGDPAAFDSPSKHRIDEMVEKSGLDKAMELLETMTVVNLRGLAKECGDAFGMSPTAISKANKVKLLKQLRQYYQQ